MPRKSAEPELTDQTLPGLDGLGQDPAPAEPKRRGRPPGSRNRTTSSGTRGKIPARSSSGRVMSKAQMEAKVAADIYTYLALPAAGWSLKDSECAGPIFEMVTVPTPDGPQQRERLEAFVERITAIIARSPDTLAYLAKSSILGDIAVALHLAMPVAVGWFKAHGPWGAGHQSERLDVDVAKAYPAYTG